METIVLQRYWHQGRAVTPDDLGGQAFTGENGAHTFQIYGVNDAGPVEIVGSIAGKVLRADNVTVPVTGFASDGVAYLTLTDDCYVCPGRIIVSIYVSDGTHEICIYCGVGNVFRTDSGTYSIGQISSDVTDLINAINAAVEDIPADYTALLAAIAPNFSSSTAYSAGQYVWYPSGDDANAALYVFRKDHAAGAWSADDAIVVTIAGTAYERGIVLMNAGNLQHDIQYHWNKGSINTSGQETTSTTNLRTFEYIPIRPGITYTITGFNKTIYVRQFDANKAYLGTYSVAADATDSRQIYPKYHAAYVRLVHGSAGTPTGRFYSEPVADLQRNIATITDGIETNLLRKESTWETGTINDSGQNATASSQKRTVDYIKTVVGRTYKITATQGNGFLVRWYDANKVFQRTAGSKTGSAEGPIENEVVARYPYVRIANNTVDSTTYPTADNNVKLYEKLAIDVSKHGYYAQIYGAHKVNCIGDSFSQPSTSWWSWIGTFTGWTMQGYGVSSSRISKDYTTSGGSLVKSFLNRYAEMDTTADAVVIFGGINDCVYLNSGVITMGDMSSALNSDTFYGALRLLIESIHATDFMPDCRILGVLPPNFDEHWPESDSHMVWLPQVRAAEKEIYEYYGIPYVDIHADCQEMYESAYNIAKYRNGTDNMHPSQDGHKAIASVILSGLERLFKGSDFTA